MENTLFVMKDIMQNLEKDLSLLKDMEVRTELMKENYSMILSKQKKSNKVLDENLKLLTTISEAVSRNLGDIIKGDFRKLIKELALGVLTAENFIKILNKNYSGGFEKNTSSKKSRGQLVADLAEELQQAGRYL